MITRFRFGPTIPLFRSPVNQPIPVDEAPVLSPVVKRELTIAIVAVNASTYPASVVIKPEPHGDRPELVRPIVRIHVACLPVGTFPPAEPALAAKGPHVYTADVADNVDGSPVEILLTNLPEDQPFQGLTIIEDLVD